MVDPKHLADLGAMIILMAQSPYHRRMPTYDYITNHLEQPLTRGQYRIYRRDNRPHAMVTWALINEHTKQALIETDRCLHVDEWDCGSIPLLNDWIAPYGGTIELARELGRTLFKDREGFSFRRSDDGKKRAIRRYHGRNIISRLVERAHAANLS